MNGDHLRVHTRSFSFFVKLMEMVLLICKNHENLTQHNEDKQVLLFRE